MKANNAFITIDQICFSWLAKKGKTIHSYYKALLLAAEAIQELSLTSLPLINHKLLTKQDNETWFMLPGDYTEWALVGIREGEHYRKIPVSNKLMSFPRYIGNGQLDNQYGQGIDTCGDYTGWLNPGMIVTIPPPPPPPPPTIQHFSGAFFGDITFFTGTSTGATAHFSSTTFSASTFFTEGTPDPTTAIYQPPALNTSGGRQDIVTFNPAKNLIMVPAGFPSNELYLVYVGIGGVDSMTHIPVIAQAAIEAYMDWKYYHNKRGRISEGREMKHHYDEQHRILRARLNPIDVVDIIRMMDEATLYPFATAPAHNLAKP